MTPLEGKVAIVTGASRGVGAALAVALAAEGCQVACAARSTADAPARTPGTLDETVAQALAAGAARGGTAVAVPTDLSREDDVLAMIGTTVALFGGIDIVVNNAAVTFGGGLEEPLRAHDLTMAINYRAPYLAIRESWPHMEQRGGGAIVNVSSLAALEVLPGMLSYGTSKIALEHLTLDAARELCSKRIAVNCFRIDVPVASEGFVRNMPGADTSRWEQTDVAAEGILWMLRQPPSYSGRRESMYDLAVREGIMPTVASRDLRGNRRPRIDMAVALELPA
jgi:NAD(P)-dependent dehydrogenase (short-subunit alcohol dehydrogenase family)